MTDVTIRGIDDEVYSKFAAEAKKSGKAIGELTTDVMRAYTERDVPIIYKIKDIANLTVSKVDLESTDGQVIFSNIALLEFLDDVDWPSFRDHVERLENIGKVVLPRSLSKFQILTKSKNIEKVITRD